MKPELHILIVEDDQSLRTNVARFLGDKGFRTHAVASAEDAEQAIKRQNFAAAVVDFRLPGKDGIQFVREAAGLAPEMACVVVTAYGDVERAVEAIKAGAFHFLEKPVSPDDLVGAVEKACEREQLRSEVRRLRHEMNERYGFESIVGQSTAMRDVFEKIRLAAPTNSTILLTGETGTGKELVARAIHTNSTRAEQPFVAVNCAALPDTLVESELFGYEKGAFTGATESKQGFFEAASGGTLFIDEIGEMPKASQAKLLRALEQRVITRVGSTTEIPVDVRILAATNQSLAREIREGRFRQDLYFRLSVLHITLPPLRDRAGDVPLLIAEFLTQLNAEHGRRVCEVTSEALDALEHYAWPGNVRELRNVLESIVVLSTAQRIDLADLPSHILRGEAPDEGARTDETPGVHTETAPQGKTLAQIEKDAIFAAIKANNGNRTQAARSLGISVRTIQRKLAEYTQG